MFSVLISILPLLASAHAAPAATDDISTRQYVEPRNVHIISGRSGLCLGKTDSASYGESVTLADCSSGKALTVQIKPDESGPQYIFAGGSIIQADQADGRKVTFGVVDKYQPPLANGQKWTIENNKIRISEGQHCLDEGDGNQLQVWTCFDWNDNQVWYLEDA